ncbi:MAG TPA: class I tRNA ligase family protein [Acidimicrobiales bacterium]|nr:class I tRNA ligase family protein [Acidimicrobiales bacterium]
MPEPLRILSSPVRLVGPLHLAHLSALVSTDALLRRARAEGRPAEWMAASLAGDLAGQTAVERTLAREGHDRATLGHAAFVERVRAFEAEHRAAAAALLAVLGVDVDLEAGALDNEQSARAARTAFVRLYEAGLLKREERVVDTCPRCATVVDPADADATELDSETVTLRLPDAEGGTALDVEVVALELLPGVVAVAVPEGHEAGGRSVHVPLGAKDVPVVVDPATEAPRMVVPAHDAAAAALGLTAVEVLDGEAVVTAAGPLNGLARYAARLAARELLAADEAVVAARPVAEAAARCRRCSTVLVPRLGAHWFLPMADLEVAAADAVREGLVTFFPAAALDTFLERAGAGGEWCLSHTVWAGQAVPVSTCLDCGRTAVEVEPSTSCGRCMGELVPDGGVLDARFVGAVWPLATGGWPGEAVGADEERILVVSPSGVGKWALPMAAVGLWLAGAVPFSRVAVHDVTATADDPDPHVSPDLPALLEVEGRRVVRAALAAGGLDLDAARALVAAVDDPPEGEADIDALVEGYTAAFAAGTPGVAVGLLAAALQEGVRPAVADRVRALAAPILGD